jgi:isopentenyl diphosphate isomerase/L-lactate dehydrogenase-like FMN-dependent dehydrogenase
MSGMFNRRELASQIVGRAGSLDPAEPPASLPAKLAPCAELVNALEFEEQAKLALSASVYETIAGGDHEPFDRITFRPRMNVPVLDMDLTVEVLGQSLFTPIIVGPIADQARYHKEGELALVRGAEAAQALVVLSSRSSLPVDRIAAQASAPFWYSAYADAGERAKVQSAAAAGAKAIVITVGAAQAYQSTNDHLRHDSVSRAANGAGESGRVAANGRIDWAVIDTLRKGIDVPVVIKGIATPEEAKTALQHNVQGLVASDYGGLLGPAKVAPMHALASIVDVVENRVPVLIDGGFRRGTCVLKALALGARAVLLGRPIAWALAGYGAEGVQAVLELIQNEFARSIAMLGVSRPQQLTREHVRIHKRATT